MNSVNEGGKNEWKKFLEGIKCLDRKKKKIPYYIPNVEEIQDLVEQTL